MIDDGALGPVEGADEVLALRKVDARLAADGRVHLAHERRRHGHPRDAAEVRGGDEATDVRHRPPADGDERACTLQAQRLPQSRADLERLRRLAGRHRVDRSVERRWMEPAHPLVDDDLDLLWDEVPETPVNASLDEDSRGRQDDVVGIACARVRRVLVQSEGVARTAGGTRSPARRAGGGGCGEHASTPRPRPPRRKPSAPAREAVALSSSRPSPHPRGRSRPALDGRVPRARASPRSRGTRPRRASRRSWRSTPRRAARSRRRDRRTDALGERPPCGQASTCRRP